ncbi:MAG: phosphatidate cytidylyltransferase [Desulfobacterales bacterium]|nr:phosphatidate cytidylyltransferase [Desulfobacterales bacterium]
MHSKRLITSVVAIPLLVLFISMGGAFLFAVFISVVCILALREFFRIVFASGEKNRSLVLVLCIVTFLISLLMIAAAYRNSFDLVSGLIAFSLMIGGLISLKQFHAYPSVLQDLRKQLQALIYIPLLLSYLVLIRNSPNGIIWIFFLLCIVFSGDSGSYYMGTYWGRRKLCPSISPNKTIEGSIGGLAANIGMGSIFKLFFLPVLPWGYSIIFFLAIGVSGQVGDLFESELKRFADIKDSGLILPGHGGILDRIDALLFAAPIAYMFKTYIFQC